MKGCMYRQNKDVIFRKEGDEAILFNPDNSDIIVINETGCFIWDMCNGNKGVEDMVDSITKEYNATAETANRDLHKFLSDLQNKKFIEKT